MWPLLINLKGDLYMALENRGEIEILEFGTKICSKDDQSRQYKATNAENSNIVPPFVALHIWKKL